MIRSYKDSDKECIENNIKKDIFQNIYLYIDTQTYGYRGENIETMVVENNETVVAVLYTYYGSLQIFENKKLNDAEISEIALYIQSKKFKMISANKELAQLLVNKLKVDYDFQSGVLMGAKSAFNEKSSITCWAKPDQCEEIAQLICADPNIGGHYTVTDLAEQLKDRMQNWGCRNLIIMDEKKIIAHMASYAEKNEIAVLGGLITHNDSRGKGYGRIVLQKLADAFIKQNKFPVLFVFNDELVPWYENMGWTIIKECGKLEYVKR